MYSPNEYRSQMSGWGVPFWLEKSSFNRMLSNLDHTLILILQYTYLLQILYFYEIEEDTDVPLLYRLHLSTQFGNYLVGTLPTYPYTSSWGKPELALWTFGQRHQSYTKFNTHFWPAKTIHNGCTLFISPHKCSIYNISIYAQLGKWKAA